MRKYKKIYKIIQTVYLWLPLNTHKKTSKAIITVQLKYRGEKQHTKRVQKRTIQKAILEKKKKITAIKKSLSKRKYNILSKNIKLEEYINKFIIYITNQNI